MKLYQINDQVNRWEDMCEPVTINALADVMRANFSYWRIDSNIMGVFRVRHPTDGDVVRHFDISVIYPAFVLDPEIPRDLKEECLKMLVQHLGMPDGN